MRIPCELEGSYQRHFHLTSFKVHTEIPNKDYDSKQKSLFEKGKDLYDFYDNAKSTFDDIMLVKTKVTDFWDKFVNNKTIDKPILTPD